MGVDGRAWVTFQGPPGTPSEKCHLLEDLESARLLASQVVMNERFIRQKTLIALLARPGRSS